MAQEQNVKSFDEELQQLEKTMSLMGHVVEDRINDAVEALLNRKSNLADD